MPQPLVVTVPHKLGKAQARQRIATGLSTFRAQFGANVTKFDDAWDGDRLTLNVVAMGQAVGARAHVGDNDVRIEVDLPWMLAMLADKIRGRVETDARKLLAAPPKKG
ncbi:MAG TPA: polyhydroxyalkanoic acid system family protein [Tepidisphaeraceae bacterium]|nr:polyhydroxyalkanoic acid system family protein [Tepidisphaeraceae bacterium]